ncbi:MAG: PAS domain-containing sensor histidine kinase, partial [Methanobacteriota archaeon]
PIRHSLHILAIPLLGNVYYLEAKERSKRARKELRESRDFIKSVFDGVHDAISVVDVKSQKLLSVNRAFLESVKMEEHEVLGRPCYEITHRRTSPCEPPDDTCPLKETAVTGGLAVAEHIHYDRDGNRHYVEVTTVPLPSGNGTVEQVIHTARDVTERKKAEEEVRRSHERLEKAYTELFGLERLKSDIIANVTHELRTPVTICGTSLELLRDAASEEERKEILSMAEDALKRLNTMVENLVSIGEVHRGELRLNIKDVDVKEAVSAAVQSLADAALKRRVTINDRLPPDLPKVRADGRALKMVLRNIIGNSIKFSKDTGGWVKIDAVREEGHLRLSISDNGIGMEEDKLQKIFQPLYQIDPTSTRAYGGMGMGLAVAESLITAMKGRIWAESQIGKGTTIHLTLPISN